MRWIQEFFTGRFNWSYLMEGQREGSIKYNHMELVDWVDGDAIN